jgi:hypothetical protein
MTGSYPDPRLNLKTNLRPGSCSVDHIVRKFMTEYTVIVLRGGTTLRFPNTDTGDCEGKEKLMDALEHAEAYNEDDEEWVNNCVRNMEVEYGDQ